MQNMIELLLHPDCDYQEAFGILLKRYRDLQQQMRDLDEEIRNDLQTVALLAHELSPVKKEMLVRAVQSATGSLLRRRQPSADVLLSQTLGEEERENGLRQLPIRTGKSAPGYASHRNPDRA